VDVGSGPGRYAIYLAERGHDVTLVDLSQRNLDRAASEASRRGLRLRALHHLSAVHMPDLQDESSDAVLCLGPLYHITEDRQRREAVSECLRVLKAVGVALFAFVSLYAHVVARIGNGRLELRPGEMEEYEYILQNQTNRNLEVVNFTHAWYTDPGQITPLMEGTVVLRCDQICFTIHEQFSRCNMPLPCWLFPLRVRFLRPSRTFSEGLKTYTLRQVNQDGS
jgi:SAM-dependent methyltransferase